MAEMDHSKPAVVLAGEAASILERHRDELIERWRTRLGSAVRRDGEDGVVSEVSLPQAPSGVVDCLLERLNGEHAETEPSRFSVWVCDACQRAARPADLTRILLDLKDAAGQVIRGHVEDELTALRLGSVVDLAVDEMIRQCAEFCGTSDEVEFRRIRDGAETASAQERSRLSLIVDAMGAGLALFDGQRRLRWANNTLTEWFELGPNSLNQECRLIYGCGGQHKASCALLTAAETGKLQSSVMERTDRSGEWHCYLLAAQPVDYGEARLLALAMDVTEQRRQTEQVHLISTLTQALEGTLDLDRVLHLVLTCVTAGHALGFNRAFVFLLNESRRDLVGRLAVGPASLEEASRIWGELSQQAITLEELLAAPGPAVGDRAITQAVQSLSVPMADVDSVLVQTLETRAPIIVRDASADKRVGPELAGALELEEFVCVPLVARDDKLGVMVADHKFSRVPIDEHQVELLRMFSAQASLAIASARAYRKISDQVEQIKQTQHELIEAERLASVGRMASHLAHEIRNPLTTIGGFAGAIKRSQTSDELTRKNASVIYDEVIRLEHTLANVLDFTRPVRPEKTLMSMNGLMRDTVREFRNVLQDNGIELRLNLQKNLPRVMADSGLMKQVIINLLKNAVEALEGRDQRHILVSTAATEKGIVTSISDSGGGMDEQTRRMVFAPFFTTKLGGSGLGLVVSQKIVTEHGGEISLESELGGGATFRVFLPREDRPSDQ